MENGCTAATLPDDRSRSRRIGFWTMIGKFTHFVLPSLLAWSCLLCRFVHGGSSDDDDYGIDCSFPIQNEDFTKCDAAPGLLGDRERVYKHFMAGCVKKYGENMCEESERERIHMNRRQPQSMVNYTSPGYARVRAPKELFKMLLEYWNKNKGSKTVEEWHAGNTYVNHWSSQTYMVNIEDSTQRGGGYVLKQQAWAAVQPVLEEWTGMELRPVSQYGIRVYRSGAILNPHVDRLPLVTSAIVCVAQEVNRVWPLEIYDRRDRAVNISMIPGDMLLYESASVIRGHPFPLSGRFAAYVYIHFEPTGRPLKDENDDYLDSLDSFYPPYLLPDSPATEVWAKRFPQGWRRPGAPSASSPQASNIPAGHLAASLGDVDGLAELARKDRSALHSRDENGWQPIHEAARGGHHDALRLLIKHGSDKDSRTGVNGRGGSTLNVAIRYLTERHPAVRYLKSIGARNIFPDEL